MNYLLHIIILTSIQSMTILGYNLIFGKGKILHFGPIATSLFGAYGTFLTLKATGSYPTALVVGFLASMLISALFAWLSLRMDGDAFGILSIALHLSTLAIVLNWTSLTRGALGVPQIPRMAGLSSLPVFLIVVVVVAVLYGLWMYRISHGSVGRALGALAENQGHAEALGVDTRKTVYSAFLIGGIGPYLGNVLYPQYIGLLHPNDYGFQALIFAMMCVVAGGPGSVRGVALATVLLMILNEGIRFVPLPLSLVGPLRLIFFGSILLVAVWVRRKTLFPQPRTI